jgi:hypothetical protein
MKHFARSAVSAALALTLAVPAFALKPPADFDRPSARTLEDQTAKKNYDRPTRREIRSARRARPTQGIRVRSEAVGNAGAFSQLMRGSMDRRLRRLTRSPKAGHEDYRILYRPNSRSIRKTFYDSGLPPSIVQTGSDSESRPTRRAIMEGNAYVKSEDAE